MYMLVASFVMLYLGQKTMNTLSVKDQNKIKGLYGNFSPYKQKKPCFKWQGFIFIRREGDYELNKETTDKSTLWDKCKKCKINV